MRARLSVSIAILFGWFVLACGSASTSFELQAPPRDENARRAAVDTLARSLFEALRRGHPSSVFAPERVLDELVVPEARMRLAQERARIVNAEPDRRWDVWTDASYRGFCAQGPQRSVASNVLRGDGWTLGHVLIAAEVQGVLSACWVEGAFAYVGGSFQALSISTIGPVRPGHADLDLAPCDVEQGIR